MWNRKKIQGIVLALVGVFLARIDLFFNIEARELFISKAIGILVAFTGIAVYGAGMNKQRKRVKACPSCFAKNDLDATLCKKCKKGLPGKSPE